MTTSQAIIKIDIAKQALIEARSIEEVLEIRDRAMAAHVYAVAKNHKEAADIAKEAQLRAERRAGEFLAKEIPHQGGRPEKQLQDATVNNPVKLEDLGIEKTQSSRWQAIAAISEGKFEQYVAEQQKGNKELTQSGLLRLAKKEQYQQEIEERNGNGHKPGAYKIDDGLIVIGDARQMDLAQFPHKYRIIIADPPWAYRVSKGEGVAKDQYKVMADQEIMGMPVGELADDNCALFLWGTWPKLPEALQVMDAWGFQFVTGFPWVKTTTNNLKSTPVNEITLSYGVGYWVRGASEFILVGRKGKASAPRLSGFLGIISPNLQHSRKPDSVHEIAEAMEGPYLELFGRRGRPGWTVFGNEVQGAF